MQVSRPFLLFLELRDRPQPELARLLSADDGADRQWIALAPHLGSEVVLLDGDPAVFEALAPDRYDEFEVLAERFGRARVERLLAAGLLIGDHAAHDQLRERDGRIRRGDWWPPSALAHAFGRWSGIDVEEVEAREGRATAARLIELRGLPPSEAPTFAAPETWRVLPEPEAGALDALLAARTTCRNFDESAIPLSGVSNLLHRVFAAQSAQEVIPGATMLKKNSPSGGGLHPIEAYLLVQRVEGLDPGVYHYACRHHALEPLQRLPSEEAANCARELVAGQSWFANAPVLVLMAARFERTHWKYPHHAKAWRVVHLDAGHLSQSLYLHATEQGYGAFITAAINDECAERMFELDGISVGAIAVCGFGKRAAEMTNVEFDPLGKAVR